MQLDLACVTDAGAFAIFDPSLFSSLFKGSPAALEAQAKAGNLIAYSYCSDGEILFRVFVGEPVDPALLAHASLPRSGILRVPSGSLLATGIEYIARKRRGEPQAIPAGLYEVVAYELSWGAEAEEAADRAAAIASPLGFAIERILGRWIAPLVGVTIAAILARKGGFLLAGLWLLVVALWEFSPARKAMQFRRAAQAKFPGAAVLLTRLPDGADLSMREGCLFGEGFTGA